MHTAAQSGIQYGPTALDGTSFRDGVSAVACRDIRRVQGVVGHSQGLRLIELGSFKPVNFSSTQSNGESTMHTR